MNDVGAINLIVMPNAPDACTGVKNHLVRIAVSYPWEDALFIAAASKVIVLDGDDVKGETIMEFHSSFVNRSKEWWSIFRLLKLGGDGIVAKVGEGEMVVVCAPSYPS